LGRPVRAIPRFYYLSGELTAQDTSVERRTRGGRTFYVTRYRDDEEKQRSKNFTRKTDADRFAATVAADRVRGTYRDPDAGKQRFEPYAKAWLWNVT